MIIRHKDKWCTYVSLAPLCFLCNLSYLSEIPYAFFRDVKTKVAVKGYWDVSFRLSRSLRFNIDGCLACYALRLPLYLNGIVGYYYIAQSDDFDIQLPTPD